MKVAGPTGAARCEYLYRYKTETMLFVTGKVKHNNNNSSSNNKNNNKATTMTLLEYWVNVNKRQLNVTTGKLG